MVEEIAKENTAGESHRKAKYGKITANKEETSHNDDPYGGNYHSRHCSDVQFIGI